MTKSNLDRLLENAVAEALGLAPRRAPARRVAAKKARHTMPVGRRSVAVQHHAAAH